jgi:hypothetical protein
MADCELLEKCIFFHDKMENMPGTAEIFKNQYCRENNLDCARFMVFKALGREKVPLYLFPNMKDRAQEIIVAG